MSTATNAAPSTGKPAAPAPAQKQLWRVFLAFVGPMILSNFLQSLSGTANSIYIGQMLGVKAMAAASSMFPIVFFLIAFIIGLGAGASVLIGQAWGARKVDRVRAVVGTTLVAGLIFGLTVAVLGFVFASNIMQLLGAPADIVADAIAYARVIMIAVPGIFVFLLLTSMLRGVGDTVSPLLALIISTALGLVITPALIRGWGGLPLMGLTSAAWASIIANVVAITWLAWRLLRRPYANATHPMAPNAAMRPHLRIDPTIFKAVLKIGVPTGVQMIVISLAEVVLLSLVNGYGSQAIAAYGAVNQIVNYVQFPAISIAITCSILGAQAIGAGKPERLGAITKTGLMMNLVLTGTMVLVGYALSRVIIRLFIADEAVVDIAQNLLHVMLWSFLLMGSAGALSGIMRASGSVIVPTAISILCIALVEVPVAYFLSKSIGLSGIWFAYPAAFTAMLILQTLYYRLVWVKKPKVRLID